MASPSSFAERITAHHKAIEKECDELRQVLGRVLEGLDSGNLDAALLERARVLSKGDGEK
ncbi:MAG: hypothetical protein Tp138OMZ00d2C19078221_54 [Prokaryotic dsDNA virus sp.]|jgi:hypothetical protein|nr:hypothetical protein [Pseudomonadales bacterium]QDP67482.1 MAG: hypothetical protein Tp138OMZ00d2C19078221_54 [Prokaryotic dsDNA virus sp.]|tara:strand:- start:25265 stop:25444 length:180 start_codon:yes stop_codon:yes gene_type:complete